MVAKPRGHKTRANCVQNALLKHKPSHSLNIMLKGLSKLGAPAAFMQLVFLLHTRPWHSSMGMIDSLELFAGKQAYTNAVAADGRVGLALDKTFNEEDDFMNFLSARGFALAMSLSLKLKVGAQTVSAPVCSTWVWMCRGTTKRTKLIPLGNQALKCVSDGNTMVSRLMLLVLIFAVKGCFFIIEQPKGSLMEFHPRFVHVSRVLGLYRKHVEMSWLACRSPKASWLYSMHKDPLDDFDLPELHSACKAGRCHKLVRTYQDKHGKTCVTGNDNLKASQAYTPAFGRALCTIYRKHEACEK